MGYKASSFHIYNLIQSKRMQWKIKSANHDDAVSRITLSGNVITNSNSSSCGQIVGDIWSVLDNDILQSGLWATATFWSLYNSRNGSISSCTQNTVHTRSPF